MNAHNEQHDSASPVVKQNLTTQPAAAQEAVAFRLLYKTHGGEWSTQGRPWVDGKPDPQIVADAALPGSRWKIEYAYGGPAPAAPGIDRDAVERLRNLADYAGTAGYPSMGGDIKALLGALDASPKGATLNEQFGNAEGLDSPKGGSEARDAARWNELCQQFDAGMLPIAIIDDAMAMGSGALELHIDEAIRAQASDAEVRP